ncbi:ESF1 [Branchiostoma lanceolatum]|uniref:ESF1 protein n=1 Tax=Branchiostoma lanceolatum TaxID=7740 RepID=A0A8J9ZWW0_BRALA|nr:ESF1 [Branchiostoma lanceolatum]
MEDLKKDSRFAHIPKDPRFRTVPNHERKVKVDKRFQGMFNDKRFKVKYQVDKRGRPINRTSKEDLRKFYEMSSTDSEEDSEEDVRTGKSKRTEKKKTNKKEAGNKSRDERFHMKSMTTKREERESSSQQVDSVERTAQKAAGSDVSDQDRESDLESSGDEAESESGSGDSGPEGDDLPEIGKLETGRREDGEDEDDDESDEDGSSDDEEEGPKVDLARGEGNMETSSSDSELEFEEDESEHEWGELDKSAPTTDDPTCRFAVCNMDWDRIKAVDLLVVFNSFKPTGGVVKSVKIFPSEYGAKRLQEEDLQGPAELLGGDDNNEEEKETEQGSKYSTERLRRYQLNRLKYYYAVVECDSVQTSAAIYKQCDGLEFELSAARMDLRFIPDDMTFDDQQPTQEAGDVPPTYKPSVFFNTALQQTSVELTWDETNKERLNVTMKKFREEDIDKLDLTEYLASSSGEEDAGLSNLIGASSDEEEKGEEEEEEKDEDQIAKYRSLLLGLDKKEEKKEFAEDMEMEVTWEPGLREKAEDLVKKKTEDKKSTPWQQYLEKKKQKKRERKQELKKKEEEKKFEDVEDSGEEDLPAGVDLGDDYFREELEQLQTVQEKRKKKEKKKVEEPTPEEEKQKAELELLMMDEEDNKRHFNMKAIIEAETQADEKKKRKKKDRNTTEEPGTKLEDNFEIDVQDPRFEAVYSSHLYNIDPSDPGYKKTKAMDALLTEKQHRRATGKKRKVPTEKKVDPAKEQTKRQEASLDMLVKSVKAKTSQFQARKKIKSS